MRVDFLVVGAGFAGSVVAERLASSGRKVLLVERRSHIGGNAYDELDKYGVMIHRYGPHIFHTNSARVFEYLSRFTDWRDYEHRVLSSIDGRLYPVPINRTTINTLYGLDLDEDGVKKFLSNARESIDPVRTSEDVVLNAVGNDLCDKFFRGYTRKQWGIDLSELKAAVAARIPTRTDSDDRYFSDVYQAIPKNGYTKMFEEMLEGAGVMVELETDWKSVKKRINADKVVFTGPVDAYFNYCFGRLPYRSIRFEHEHYPDVERWQKVGTINYPNEYDYTRITEFKHITGQAHRGTSIVKEYPQSQGDPYYPVPTEQSRMIYLRYKEMVARESGAIFIGRLAQYRYYNMDQVVAAALAAAKRLVGT